MLEAYRGTLRYVLRHWPRYLFGVGGGSVVAMGLALFSTWQGLWFLLPLVFLGLLLLLYGLGISLWMAYEQFDNPQLNTAVLFQRLGQFKADDTLLHIELGDRYLALALVRPLTTGHLHVVDVYEPSLMPARVLPRLRQQAPAQQVDPRLTWQVGRVDLLPLPNAAVFGVTVAGVAGQIWQEGDRQLLFDEIARVLRPGGRLLLAERVRSEVNWLALGPWAVSLPTAEYWEEKMRRAGLTPHSTATQRGLVHVIRADKRQGEAGRQLPLWDTARLK